MPRWGGYITRIGRRPCICEAPKRLTAHNSRSYKNRYESKIGHHVWEGAMKPLFTLILSILSLISLQIAAQAQSQRTLFGVITTGRNEVVAGATITVRSPKGDLTATSDNDGNFKLTVPAEALIVKVTGKNIFPLERKID